MQIIGIMGKAGAGKDTIGRMLSDRHLVGPVGDEQDIRKRLGIEGGEVVAGIQLAMADPMKVFCQEVYDFSFEQLWGPSECRNAPDERYPRYKNVPYDVYDERMEIVFDSYLTPREALQTLGTEWGRGCHIDTWIRLAMRRATNLLNANAAPLIVLTDVRFINEARVIKETGGHIWRVVRPSQAALEGSFGAHKSEQEQNDPAIDQYVDVDLLNADTIDHLRTLVRHALAA